MRTTALVLAVVILCIVGCIYEAPLTDEHSIPVDPSVLGVWEYVPKPGESAKKLEMVILKYSENEYLVHYPTGQDGMYFRGYAIKLGDVSCAQIQLIGTAKGAIKKEDRKYHVISYNLANDELEVKLLNTDLVGENIKTSADLRKAFLQHKDHKALFINPAKFRKVKNR